jgi:hypothetical protein
MDAKEAEIRTDQEKIRKKPNKNRLLIYGK